MIRFAPVMGWPEGFSSTRGMSRELTRIFDGAAAACAKQVVVLVADGVAGVAVDDLVSGVVRVLVGHLGGINPMVGHEHAFQSIEDQQLGLGVKLHQQWFLSSVVFLRSSFSGCPVM